VVFDHVRLFADEVIPWKHAGAQLSALPFWTTFGAVYYSAVYLGSALAALDTARDYARNDTRQSISPGAASLAKDPLILTQYGELWIKAQAALAYFDKTIEELQAGWDKRAQISEEELGVLAAKTLALRSNSSQVALEITPKVFEFAGGRGSNQDNNFDRFWRDARTLATHDPLIYSLRSVGDFALNDVSVRFPSRFQAKPEAADARKS
jgi:alkylation response protein AidB-like acyl-CoA dehydrogenase